MLCFEHHPYGEICTNRCSDRQSCAKKRIPLLIEALDILASDLEIGEVNGIPYTSFKSYCVAPEAYINGLVTSILENTFETICFVPCYVCGKAVTMPDSQKEDFAVNNYTKYNKITIAYCSKDCQIKHLEKLKEAKNVASGSLKNHEAALIIHGADVTKRLKEKEVHAITGTVTEQRARCLYENLMLLTPRKKRKYMSSNEVQLFLLNELPDSIKATKPRIWVTAHDVMDKTKDLFPNLILIGRSGRRSRYIEIIN